MAGGDEAGRGSLVGPLIVAGVSAEREAIRELVELGVRDSKLLSPMRRRLLYPEILRVSRFVVPLRVEPPEIDQYVKLGRKYRKLNYLEAIYMARVIDQLGAKKVIVDSPDIKPTRFATTICELMKTKCAVTAEHYADRRYPLVSAASIIAKVERDQAVERLRNRYGDFGSGYPSDQRTRAFLSNWLEREGSMPSFTRKSWRSWRRIAQMRL